MSFADQQKLKQCKTKANITVHTCINFNHSNIGILFDTECILNQIFSILGWESQLLETGFLAIFLCPAVKMQQIPVQTPTPLVVIWGYRWLIFRIMIGAVSNYSG